MSVLSTLSKPIARFAASRIKYWSRHAAKAQDKIFQNLIRSAKETAFGKDHHFSSIRSYEDFKTAVPVRDYEELKLYIERIKAGEANILWPGKPLYLSKTSGTTSGVKYIPITKDSLPNHLDSTRNAMFSYIAETGNTDFLKGKLIFISGSPVLDEIGGIKTGRLSGIVNYHVPDSPEKSIAFMGNKLH